MQAFGSTGADPEEARDVETVILEEASCDHPLSGTVSATEMARVRQGIMHVRVLHLFRTLEEVFDASLRAQPFVIGTGYGRPGEPGRIIDASAAAMRLGVLPGMSLRRAYRVAPHVRFLAASFERYQPALQRLSECYRGYSRIVEPCAPGEIFIDLQGCKLSFPSPVALAERLQAEIEEMGLTCLIGIASGKVLAELAALMSRKEGRNGVYLVPAGNESAFVQALPLSLLISTRTAVSELAQGTVAANPGQEIPATEGPAVQIDNLVLAELVAHLKDFGITTFAQLASLTEEGLRRRLGPAGLWLHQLARGEDSSFVIPDAPSLQQNARTRFHAAADAEETCAAIRKLANYLGERLRSQRFKGKSITLLLWPGRSSSRLTLQLGHDDGEAEETTPPTADTICGRLSLVQHTDDDDVIAYHALMLFAQYHSPALRYAQVQLRIDDMLAPTFSYTPPYARSRGKLTRKL